jgi:hypothetical protein
MKYSVSSVSINTVIKGVFNNVNDSNTTIEPHRQNFYVHYDGFIFFHNQCSYILAKFNYIYMLQTLKMTCKSQNICFIHRKSNKRLYYLVFVNCELLYWNQMYCTTVRFHVLYNFFFFAVFA